MNAEGPGGQDPGAAAILRAARQLERDGERLYRELAALAANPALSKIFGFLAGQENEHFSWLQALAASRGQAAEKTRAATAGQAARLRRQLETIFARLPASVRRQLAGAAGERQALAQARLMEEQSRVAYAGWAAAAAGLEVAELCRLLAGQEAEHAALLARLADEAAAGGLTPRREKKKKA